MASRYGKLVVYLTRQLVPAARRGTGSEKVGVAVKSLLGGETLPLLIPKVPEICHRDPRPVARAGIPTRAASHRKKCYRRGVTAILKQNIVLSRYLVDESEI